MKTPSGWGLDKLGEGLKLQWIRWLFLLSNWSRGVFGRSNHRIHRAGIFKPTFTIKINEMQVNLPYMDPMGYRANLF